MSRNEKESLVARWSRVKSESTARKGEAPAAAQIGGEQSRAGDGSGKRQGAQAPGHGSERRDNNPRDSNQRDSTQRDSTQRDDDAPLRLPPLEELGPDSDFQAFMDPRVDDETRRAALKRLFRDPAFNVTDGLDVYARDYSKLEKLTPAMVAALRYAQRNLFGEREPSEQGDMAEGAASESGTIARAKAADEPSQSGETTSVATAAPAADRGESGNAAGYAVGSDDQAGSRAGPAKRDRPSREQSAEQSGEAGSKDCGTRCG